MATHSIDLNNRQEDALQSIVDGVNAMLPQGATPLTPDTWIRQQVVAPIKQRIREMADSANSQILAALPDASLNQLNQIKTILGLP